MSEGLSDTQAAAVTPCLSQRLTAACAEAEAVPRNTGRIVGVTVTAFWSHWGQDTMHIPSEACFQQPLALSGCSGRLDHPRARDDCRRRCAPSRTRHHWYFCSGVTHHAQYVPQAFLLIARTSALTMTVAGVAKVWVLTALEAAMYQLPVSRINFYGYASAFVLVREASWSAARV